MPNYAAPFLNDPWQESGYVFKGDERDIECITETNKPCCFNRRIDVQTTSKDIRLITNNTDTSSIETCKSYDDVFSIIRKQFKEFSIINNFLNDTDHVVWSIGVVWNKRFELIVNAVDWIISRDMWWFSIIMIRKIGKYFLNEEKGIVFIVCNQACNS